MRIWAGLAVAALAIVLASTSAPAVADPPGPAGLRVGGGEDAWHPENRFTLEWTNPPAGAGPPPAAVGYRIRDPLGATIGESRIGWVSDGIAAITLPRVPGAYTAEVWFEGPRKERSAVASAQLRFDDARPAPVEISPVPGWIGRTSFPLRVRLGHPVGPAPISGIRGYAAAIDAVPDGEPCGKPDRCTDAETTLRGGVADDTLTIPALPEGTSYLHAAAVSGSGMKSPNSGQAVLRVDTTDPVTQLLGAPTGWTGQAVGLIANATDGGSGMVPQGTGPAPITAIRIDGGTPVLAPGGTVAATAIAEGVHRISFYARDAAGNVDDGGNSNGIANSAPQIAWVRIDRSPPVVAFANSGDPREPDLIRARVADALAGADPSRGWIGVRRAGSGDPFEPLPPSPPADGELRVSWDRSAYPAGDYEFRAIGYDAAGNATATMRRESGAPMVLSIAPKAPTLLRAGFGGRVANRTVPFGRGVSLSGRLTYGGGPPPEGTPIRVVERFASPAAPPTRVSVTRTEPDGSFSVRLDPGPSREVVASFDGSETLNRSASRTLRIGVRSAVRLSTSSALAAVGGAPLVFRGRVVAPPGAVAGSGKSVQLQFRLAGLPWEEFRTVQADRRGRFRYAYRFSDDDSRGARFQFRAYVPAQDDWPYEPGGSRPVIVRGR